MALLRPDIISALRDRAKGPSRINEGQRPLSFHKPLESGELDAVERRLGFALPAGVRQIYGEVANGGFGPGYGLIGLAGGALSDLRRDAVDEYLIRCEPDPHDQGRAWPRGILPICHWGCGIYSCVDCRDETSKVIRFDPNPVDRDWSVAWGSESHTLASWLEAWLREEELFVAGTPGAAYGPD